MITNYEHFAGPINDLNQMFWDEKLEITHLSRTKSSDFDQKRISEIHENCFLNFPIEIKPSSDVVGISILATELLDIYHQVVELKRPISAKDKQEILKKREGFNPKDCNLVLEEFTEELMHSLVFCYDRFLSNTLKRHYFVGINDEAKVLVNILKRYKNVLLNSAVQIDIFWLVQLTKEMSDAILRMLIDFIEHRLEILSSTMENYESGQSVEYVSNSVFPLKWRGSQQELCELVLELEEKCWIDKIRQGQRKKVATSITSLFDLSETRRNPGSNPENSFYQLFKGEHIDNNRTFPFLEKDGYLRSFGGINARKDSNCK